MKIAATQKMEWIDSYKKVKRVVDRMKALRKEVGFELDIALDFHGRVHKGMAKVLIKELENK